MLRWFKRFDPTPQVLPSQTAYALWAANYPAEAHNRLMELEQSTMLGLLPPLAGKVVLDLACGTGRYAQIAHKQGAARVIGLDNSLPMLQTGKLPNAALAPLETLPLPDTSVDVILCGLAIGHVEALENPLREMQRVLKPQGIVLLSDFHPFQALSGGQRTFSAGGKIYAVEHHIHLYSDYVHWANAAQLSIVDVQEPRLADISPAPVVLVLRLQKQPKQ